MSKLNKAMSAMRNITLVSRVDQVRGRGMLSPQDSRCNIRILSV